MATYVLVHGAWHGGWCWRKVAPLLRAAGHEAHAPTLTGLGERVHLATPAVGLDTGTLRLVVLVQIWARGRAEGQGSYGCSHRTVQGSSQARK